MVITFTNSVLMNLWIKFGDNEQCFKLSPKVKKKGAEQARTFAKKKRYDGCHGAVSIFYWPVHPPCALCMKIWSEKSQSACTKFSSFFLIMYNSGSWLHSAPHAIPLLYCKWRTVLYNYIVWRLRNKRHYFFLYTIICSVFASLSKK